MAEPLRLLMVCLGNICRSPMAEGALRARLQPAGIGGIEVDSAGLGDWHAGQPPDPRAIACAARHGVDIGAQRARILAREDYARWDWMLCADRSVLEAVEARRPAGARARMALLADWSGTGPGDIDDPYTGGVEDFERAWHAVDAAAQAIAARGGGASA